MLIAQKFLPLVSRNLKVIAYLTVPLFTCVISEVYKSGKFLRVAEEAKFRNKSRIAVPYGVVVLLQLGYACLRKEPVSVIIQSLTYSTNFVNLLIFALGHYQLRNEIAALFNAFIQFETRYNRNFLNSIKLIRLYKK